MGLWGWVWVCGGGDLKAEGYLGTGKGEQRIVGFRDVQGVDPRVWGTTGHMAT